MTTRYRRDPAAITPDAFVSFTLSEVEWQDRVVIPLLRRLGWRVHVIRRSDRGHHPGADDGWPDLFATRERRAVAIELKATDGRLADDQGEWLHALGRVPGIEALVVRMSADTTDLEAFLR